MEFITLQTVLDGIVASIPPRPYVSEPIADKFKDDELMLTARQFLELTAPHLDDARRFSEAAQNLNKALHHDAKPPQWAQYDKVKGFAVPADSISVEGVDLLTHATGWGKREQKLHAEHIADCERNGLHPAWNDPARNMNDAQTPAGSFFRFHEIGFDRAELIPFLDANAITHDLGGLTQPAPAQQAKAKAAPVVSVWETQAQQRAIEILERQRAKDLYPSQVDIADEVANEFRAAGVVGVGGKPLTGASIKRHALKGISSEQGKQLSTTTSRGK